MSEKKIIIRIGPNGQREVEAVGFEGHSCAEATREIERLLGNVVNVEYKAEWWAVNGGNVIQNGIDTSNLCG